MAIRTEYGLLVSGITDPFLRAFSPSVKCPFHAGFLIGILPTLFPWVGKLDRDAWIPTVALDERHGALGRWRAKVSFDRTACPRAIFKNARGTPAASAAAAAAGKIIAKKNSLATSWLQKVVTAPVLHLLHFGRFSTHVCCTGAFRWARAIPVRRGSAPGSRSFSCSGWSWVRRYRFPAR